MTGLFGSAGVRPAYFSDASVAANPSPAHETPVQAAPVQAAPVQAATEAPRMRIVPNARDVARERTALPEVPVNPPYPQTERLQSLSDASFLPLAGVSSGGDIMPWVRFGVIDNGVLILSALAGFSLDKMIAQRIGSPGYGPIIGALVGNAIADGVAASSDGMKSGAAAMAGALLPVVPLGVAMYMRKPLKGKTALIVGTSTMLLVGLAFRKRIMSALTGG